MSVPARLPVALLVALAIGLGACRSEAPRATAQPSLADVAATCAAVDALGEAIDFADPFDERLAVGTTWAGVVLPLRAAEVEYRNAMLLVREPFRTPLLEAGKYAPQLEGFLTAPRLGAWEPEAARKMRDVREGLARAVSELQTLGVSC